MRGSLTDLNELGKHIWHLTNQSECWRIRFGGAGRGPAPKVPSQPTGEEQVGKINPPAPDLFNNTVRNTSAGVVASRPVDINFPTPLETL